MILEYFSIFDVTIKVKEFKASISVTLYHHTFLIPELSASMDKVWSPDIFFVIITANNGINLKRNKEMKRWILVTPINFNFCQVWQYDNNFMTRRIQNKNYFDKKSFEGFFCTHELRQRPSEYCRVQHYIDALISLTVWTDFWEKNVKEFWFSHLV